MICEEPAGVWPAVEVGSNELHAVDFTDRLSRRWRAQTEFVLGVAMRPGNGYQYSSSGGQSGRREPIWPKTIGLTVTEGSITWTCEALDTSSLLTTVLSVAWTPDTGVTVSGEALDGQIASAQLDAASASYGVDYTVLVTATCVDGQVIPKRCILPVRKAVRVCCA